MCITDQNINSIVFLTNDFWINIHILWILNMNRDGRWSFINLDINRLPQHIHLMLLNDCRWIDEAFKRRLSVTPCKHVQDINIKLYHTFSHYFPLFKTSIKVKHLQINEIKIRKTVSRLIEEQTNFFLPIIKNKYNGLHNSHYSYHDSLEKNF